MSKTQLRESSEPRHKRVPLSARLLLLLLSPVWIPLVVLLVLVFLTLYALAALVLHLALWSLWGPLGRRVLFVYSSSPVWQPYIEEHILPKLPARSLVLNWSLRRNWRRLSLGYFAFAFFGGDYAYNPMAIVVRPLRWVKVFRFWQPFRDFKHGNEESLLRVQAEFFSCLGMSHAGKAI